MPEVVVAGYGEILAEMAAQGSTLAQLVLEGTNVPRSQIIQAMQNAGWQQLGDAASNTFYTAKSVSAGNGLATTISEVAEIATVEAETTTTVTATASGASLLGMEVGAAGAAIAPALGILAGVGLYNLAPEFWDGVADTLMEAGELVNGKVQGILNKNGKTSFNQNTIEIYKNAFLAADLYQSTITPTPSISESIRIQGTRYGGTVTAANYNANISKILMGNSVHTSGRDLIFKCKDNTIGGDFVNAKMVVIGKRADSNWPDAMIIFPYMDPTHNISYAGFEGNTAYQSGSLNTGDVITYDGVSYLATHVYAQADYYSLSDIDMDQDQIEAFLCGVFYLGNVYLPYAQPDATYPAADPFPSTYPQWQPNKTIDNVPYYPVAMPTPSITQGPSQSGDNDGSEQQEELVGLLYMPSPEPEPEPEPEPDPQPEPEPEPDPEITTPDDPTDPNPDPEESETTPILPVLDSFSADALFTVYNPTDGQLNSLGGYLWSTSIIEQIKQIWQNPIDGVIALHKVYASPSTGSSKNIKLGYLDTGVSSAVVTSQFVDIDCGTITVPENKHNATDYSPFTQLQIYLPFVGIQELDTNEIMGGSINLKYRVDVYTGTCLAMIYVTRAADMSSAQLLYTFSGNASQKLPLTASDFGGAISSLLGIVGVGVASGGALGAAAAVGAAHSLTSEMVHIQHSGGLSANSGLLGPRTPFLIISRQYGYDANGYSEFYGFPANKTVYLNNCTGFVRVKEMKYKGDGTESEKNEILNQLKAGVFI